MSVASVTLCLTLASLGLTRATHTPDGRQRGKAIWRYTRTPRVKSAFGIKNLGRCWMNYMREPPRRPTPPSPYYTREWTARELTARGIGLRAP